MMESKQQTILLVSDDAELCAAARKEFESRGGGLRVAAVCTIDAARRIVEQAAPTVILLEDTSISAEGEGLVARMPRLNAVVSALTVHAPVVVIGRGDQESELAPMVAAGSADFVERNGGCFSLALERVERRLHEAQQATKRADPLTEKTLPNAEAFGELIRHEMNNPLTGILGNAELLLAEVRRKDDGRLPQGGQQRLETIAALAVRLRETVRRLSQECETRHQSAQ
jgi:signal transduction histidine kinase